MRLIVTRYVLTVLCCLLHFGLAYAKDSEVGIPLFIENKGQWPSQVLFKLPLKNGAVYLERDGITYDFWSEADIEQFYSHGHKASSKGSKTIHCHAYKVHFVGADPLATIDKSGESESIQNYFIGNNPAKWAGNVRSYSSIVYQGIYPGIDLRLHVNAIGLKYDFIVAPGVSQDSIRLLFEGVSPELTASGTLRLKTSVNEVVEDRPLAYGATSGKIIKACSYVVRGNELSFLMSKEANRLKENLVIDPQIIFSTFSGSLVDNWGFTATYDKKGNGYMGGRVFGSGYPATVGAYDNTYNGSSSSAYDIGISKFNPDGTKLLYATYVGGGDAEQPHSMIVNKNGDLYVFGRSASTDFPVPTGGAQIINYGGYDLVVFKLDSTGSQLLAATYIGGAGDEGVNITETEEDFYAGYSLKYNYADDARGEINLDKDNNVYVASNTRSTDAPIKKAIQATLKGDQDAYIVKLDSNLEQFKFATYLGGVGDDAAYSLELLGDSFYVAGGTNSADLPATGGTIQSNYSGGIDGFLARFYESGTMNLNLTYLGTTAYDQAYFVHPDRDGNIFVFGQTGGQPTLFPSTVYNNPKSGQFLKKISSDLKTVYLSTVVGSGRGRPDISPTAFTVDSCGRIFFSGWGGHLIYSYADNGLSTAGLPVTQDAYQSSTDGRDFYFMVLGPDASYLAYATFLGGTSDVTEHVDGGTSRFDDNGVIYQSVCAACNRTNFPTTPGAYSPTNQGPNCNNALVKFDTRPVLEAAFTATPKKVCEGFAIQFENFVPEEFEVQWDLGDGNTSTDRNPSHTYAKPGVYHVTLEIINSGCFIGKKSITDSVEVMPGIKIRAGNDTIVCPGEPFLLSATGCPSIKWSPQTGLATPNQATTSGTTTSTRMYFADNGASSSQCYVRDTVQVNIKPEIDLAVNPGIDTICGAPQTFVLRSSYHSATANYTWKFGSVLQSTEDSLVYSFNEEGNYVFQLKIEDDKACSKKDSTNKVITVYPHFELDAIDSVILCKGDTTWVQVKSNASPVTYSWQPTTYLVDETSNNLQSFAQSNTTYVVTGTSHQCKAKKTVFVQPLDRVLASIVSGTDTNCIPFSTNFKAIANPSAGSSFEWFLGANKVSTADAAHLAFNKPGKYGLKVVVSNAGTCNLKDTLDRAVVALDNISVPYDTLLSFCKGDTSEVINLTVPYSNVTYTWTGGGNDLLQLSPGIVRFFGDSIHNYTLVYVFNECVNKTVVTVKSLNYLKPDIQVMKEDCGTILLNGKTVSAQQYRWDLGDGSTATTERVSHFYPDTGTYMVRLHASGDRDLYCPQDILKAIKISQAPGEGLVIPNIFTPDNDGVNDVFEIRNAGANCIPDKIVIYSRWGDKIYQASADKYWDGTWKGSLVPDGTYYYVISLESGGHFSGYVTVLSGGK